jgi:ribonuclease HI
MTTDRDELIALIKRQPPMSSERFWQQVEKARASSPNVELPRVDSETKLKKNEPSEKETPPRFRDAAGV